MPLYHFASHNLAEPIIQKHLAPRLDIHRSRFVMIANVAEIQYVLIRCTWSHGEYLQTVRGASDGIWAQAPVKSRRKRLDKWDYATAIIRVQSAR